MNEPQPPWDASAGGYPPPLPTQQQERKKRKIWPWILGAFGILALGIGGCSFVAYRAFSAPIDQANEFIAAVDRGDFAGAAAMTAADPICFESAAEPLIADFFGSASIEDYELSSVDISSGDGSSRATASGTIDIEGQPQRAVQVNLLKEDGEWKVCGFSIEP